MKPSFTRLLILALATLAVLAAACGSSQPQELTFDVVIANDSWNLEGEIIKVKQGDHITFNVESDVRGGFHLHGYDLYNEVAPGQPASFDFTADATGNFEIMLHKFTLASDREDGMDHQDGHGGSGGEDEELEVRLGWFQVFPR
jgi:heme/copper-type cytochrome/quinol oxidase subunit 2